MPPAPLLSLRGITKRFPGVVALQNVSLDLAPGEVLALCGENGAGKSTLMKILGGVYQPDEGVIEMESKAVKIGGVGDAIRLGIGFIHQELNVLDNLDLAGNIFLGREPRLPFGGLIDSRKIHADTKPLLERLGLKVPSTTKLSSLSIAHRQLVEIAKALSVKARIIIMDEPTSSLTLQEAERLMQLVAELKAQGISIIYISHRLGEVDRCADRVVVLRDGRNAGGLSRAEISHDSIVSLMVGREIKNDYRPSAATKTPGYLKVRNAFSSRYPGHKIGFDAARGEILGFAGLVGAGRSELAKAMVGLDDAGGAEVSLGGETLRVRSSRDAIDHGIYLVPEDRRGEGLVTGMTVRENVTLSSLAQYSKFWLIQNAGEKVVADAQIKSLRIKTPSCETLAMNLSGGNQQKIVIGKWLSMSPKVLILDEPTRGIDVGAKADIYRLMRELADAGAVILMISSDMEEVLNVSDRVAIMHEGHIRGVLERHDCTENNIMQLAVGGKVACAIPPF